MRVPPISPRTLLFDVGNTMVEERSFGFEAGIDAVVKRDDIAWLAAFLERERTQGVLPWNSRELQRRFAADSSRSTLPIDPFDGSDYGYEQRNEHFLLWSSGPDGESWTDDDVRYDSRLGRIMLAGESTARR